MFTNWTQFRNMNNAPPPSHPFCFQPQQITKKSWGKPNNESSKILVKTISMSNSAARIDCRGPALQLIAIYFLKILVFEIIHHIYSYTELLSSNQTWHGIQIQIRSIQINSLIRHVSWGKVFYQYYWRTECLKDHDKK